MLLERLGCVPMGKIKKIVLFIVEGRTDETSLSLILSKLINNSSVQVHVINHDITSDFKSSSQNIIRKIDLEVKSFLEQNIGIRKSDIKEIIHLVDTDGAFIDKERIIENENCEKTFYSREKIYTNKRKLIQERNERKACVLTKLYQTEAIGNIDYRVYFFSTNLEHVLHDSQNTDCHKKAIYSYKFVDEYAGKERAFVEFISDEKFAVPGRYRETWRFIEQDLNSLNRFCNLHLFFKDKAHFN